MDERAFSVRNMFGSTGDARNYVGVQDPIAGALRSVSARITGMAQESSRVFGLTIVLSKNRSKRGERGNCISRQVSRHTPHVDLIPH